MTAGNRLVSVIVNNYNYGRFLGDAIDSALDQTYKPVEVIVVDDGSTDQSAVVIARYGGRIIPLLKANGGQASAFNVGIAASGGDVVIFLDADDTLLPTAVEQAVAQFRPGVVKVHWPLWLANERLERTGHVTPGDELPRGDLRERTFRDGPATSLSAPTSGNAWSREFLERIGPIPESSHRIGADGYLYGLAPAFGKIERLENPQGVYRVHRGNGYRRMPVDERIRLGTTSFEQMWDLMEREIPDVATTNRRADWERGAYFHQLRSAVAEIERMVPADATFVLLDDAHWAIHEHLGGRMVLPFPERNGEFCGRPDDDQAAVAELTRLRVERNAGFLVVAWPAFWWLEYYAGFDAHLRQQFPEIFSSDRLRIFDLGR